MSEYKPLNQDDASPCMKCGSVQCAFCSDDIKSAVQGLYTELKKQFGTSEKRTLRLNAIVGRWFEPIFENKVMVKGK